LHVVGTGRQEAFLRSIAKPNIQFLGRVSDEVLRDEYSGALGFIYPQVEDFGIMPLEAASCGTATLAYAKGGSLETVIPEQTGELFFEQSAETIIKYCKNWHPEQYRTEVLKMHALQFSKTIFQQKTKAFIDRAQLPHRH
jgi:glycosyltransferase involved in cell wall biosynthesis